MGTLNTRISLRYDTLENWSTTSGKSVVLNKGEIGICAVTVDGATQSTVMFKVGNGISTFEELPWTYSLAADVHNWAKQKGIKVVYEGQGEIVTNISWDENQEAIKITSKTLTAVTEQFATQGMIASCNNGTLVLTEAPKAGAVISVSLN